MKDFRNPKDIRKDAKVISLPKRLSAIDADKIGSLLYQFTLSYEDGNEIIALLEQLKAEGYCDSFVKKRFRFSERNLEWIDYIQKDMESINYKITLKEIISVVLFYNRDNRYLFNA